MTRTITPRVRRPVRAPERRLIDIQGSGSAEPPKADRVGSGSEGRSALDELLPKGRLLPVSLTLRFDLPLERGNESVRRQLNQSVSLIHAQDPAFACCWFSRAIDLGDESGDPVFWMLEWTAADSWRLYPAPQGGRNGDLSPQIEDWAFPDQAEKGPVQHRLRLASYRHDPPG